MMEDAPIERNESLEKRNFHLSLSITNGQELAHLSGFSIPSEDVQKHEIMDVLSKWLVLFDLGIIDEIHKCANWIVETTSKVNNFNDEQEEASRVFVTSYAIATLIHLFDSQHIDYLDNMGKGTSSIDIKKLIMGEE
jgi:hypothetical protein